MTILLGALGGAKPPTTPETFDGPVERSHLIHTWTGWDGSVWDLCGPTSAIQLMPGVRGMSMPPADRYTNQAPAVAGSRWRGMRTLEREVFWPVSIFLDGTDQDWLDYDRAFWRTMDPSKTGVWTVRQPNGQSRSLRCRFMDDGQQRFDVDPALIGWTAYGITLVAEDPYWYGDPQVNVFQESPPQNFFGGNTSPRGGPPFFISSSNTLASASLNNDGDVEAFPIFTVEGPTTSVTVGVGGKNTVIPFQVSAGNSVVLDMSPAEQTAIDSAGKDRTSELTNPAFVAVPPGQKVPLTIQMVGTGSVTVEYRERFYRAW